MTDRVNGGIGAKEALTGDMEFFTINTVNTLEEGAWGASNSGKRNLIKLVEALSMGAQPVLVSVTSAVVDLSVAGTRTFYGLGSNFNQASTTVYTFKFAVEHSGVWGAVSDADDSTVSGSVANKLSGLAMPYTTAGVPITGPSTVSASSLITASGATKNTAIFGYSVL